jgi:hypothetical protein
MSVVTILFRLLQDSAPLVAEVPASRILAGVIPDTTALPAIGVLEVVTTELPHVDGHSPFTLAEAVGDVTVVAANYPELKRLVALVRKACNYRSGTVGSFSVVQVRRLSNGPDFSDVDAKFYTQTVRFEVIYQEPNT